MGRYSSFIPFDHLVETCMEDNFKYTIHLFLFQFHFKPLENTREDLVTFNFMQSATPDSRGIQLF